MQRMPRLIYVPRNELRGLFDPVVHRSTGPTAPQGSMKVGWEIMG